MQNIKIPYASIKSSLPSIQLWKMVPMHRNINILHFGTYSQL